MLVDDEPRFRTLLRTLFGRTEEFAVVGEADDGDAAISVVQQHTPDVVVTDLQMPASDGLELTRSLRATHPDLPIVMLTGFPGPDAMLAAFTAGVTAFLDKGEALELPTLLRDLLTSDGDARPGRPEGAPG